MDFSLKQNGKKILIVSNYLYQSFLFSYKNKHPELDIKFMNNEELRDILSFVYLKDPLPFLIKEKGIEYNKAKKYLSLLKASNSHTNKTLKSLYNELLGEYIPLKKDSLDLYEINLYDIYLFEQDEDITLKALLDKNQLKYQTLHFIDLEEKETNFYLHPDIKIFTNKFDQYFYIFSKIRERILLNDLDKNNISILTSGNNDLFYIELFSNIFKIDCFARIKTPLYLNKAISQKLNNIALSRSFSFSSEELANEDLKTLYNLIKEYRLDEIDDFDYAYLNLIEISRAKTFVEDYSTQGLSFKTTYDFDKCSINFITNFDDDNFYNKKKDNNVLNDEELLAISFNPSYVETLLDKRLKHNYLKYMNIALLSRVEQHLADKIYDSSFIEELNWKDKVHHEDLLNNGVLTEEAKKLYKAHIYDQSRFKLIDEEVNTYDHSFKGLSNTYDLFKNRTLSVSQLKEYASCPFKYYLGKIIPSIDDEKHQLWKGTLIHKVLEEVYKDDYDYEKAFEAGKAIYYKEMDKANYKYNKKEEIFISIIHDWLYPVVISIRNELKSAKYYFPLNKDYEISLSYKINNTLIKGSIDKIMFTSIADEKQPTNSKKYYMILDYKSGSHKSDIFDPRLACTGYDIQLPLYMYAINNDGADISLDDATFAGLGIKHIYGSSIKDGFVESGRINADTINRKLITKGIFKDDVDFFKSLSEDSIGKNGKITKAKIVSNNPLFNEDEEGLHKIELKFNKEVVDYSLEEMISDAIKQVSNNIDAIKEGKFDIAPICTSIMNFGLDRLTCKYCPYRDVCYRTLLDVRDLKHEIVDPKFYSRLKKGEQEDA